MTQEQGRPLLPEGFDELDEKFFSLGQDDNYYDTLNSLGPEIRDKILNGLRDVALDARLCDAAFHERVTGVSLLRSVTPATVTGQFRRLARGGARLSRYDFSYTAPAGSTRRWRPLTLSFAVEPESEPPTNIHVLVGRNGVGKTHLLNLMTRALVETEPKASDVGEFALQQDASSSIAFANVVSVTFSAFDDFEPLPVKKDKSAGVQYFYIGLKRTGTGREGSPKSPTTLSKEFSESVKICRQGARNARWRRALQMLQPDPNFKEADVAELANHEGEAFSQRATTLFKRLSSGHKIVLLTITRLVETVEERTLVLLDEPEAHLHPPLLSAFVRALSDLLVNRNGVAVVATHLPSGAAGSATELCLENPTLRSADQRRATDIETFGENVGVLTRELFMLEVTNSGFHNLLREAVERDQDFQAVVERFSGHLGGEAKELVRALIAAREDQ